MNDSSDDQASSTAARAASAPVAPSQDNAVPASTKPDFDLDSDNTLDMIVKMIAFLVFGVLGALLAGIFGPMHGSMRVVEVVTFIVLGLAGFIIVPFRHLHRRDAIWTAVLGLIIVSLVTVTPAVLIYVKLT